MESTSEINVFDHSQGFTLRPLSRSIDKTSFIVIAIKMKVKTYFSDG